MKTIAIIESETDPDGIRHFKALAGQPGSGDCERGHTRKYQPGYTGLHGKLPENACQQSAQEIACGGRRGLYRIRMGNRI